MYASFSSLSTSPHPTLPFYTLPNDLTQVCLEPELALDRATKQTHGEGLNLLVDIVPPLIFPLMSLIADATCAALVYIQKRILFLG